MITHVVSVSEVTASTFAVLSQANTRADAFSTECMVFWGLQNLF